MNTEKFIKTLKSNLNKDLLFEYLPNELVKANYHLTEIKNHDISSVDCGGEKNAWKETIVQLWENPLEISKTDYMKTNKALEIIERVNAIKTIDLNTILKIEYGNDKFHTAHLLIENIIENEDALIIQLHNDNTQCKALDQCCPSEEKKAIKMNEIESKKVKCC